jgi:hypothetical protein
MSYLRDSIGQEILGMVPMLNPNQLQTLKLHGVEEGGIWVESNELTQLMLAKISRHASSKTPIFFVPFHQIQFLLHSTEQISLSEKAFGV